MADVYPSKEEVEPALTSPKRERAVMKVPELSATKGFSVQMVLVKKVKKSEKESSVEAQFKLLASRD